MRSPAGTTSNRVLALPAVCEADDDALCWPSTYYGERAANLAPKASFPEMIEPIVRLKLELAGYTLVDARTLRLEGVERTETRTSAERSGSVIPEVTTTEVGEAPTVASLPPADRAAAALSIGLTGELSTMLRPRRDHHRVRFDLEIAMRALPGGEVLWTASCSELEEEPRATAELLAGCAADGVLAWRAPDAVIGGVP